MSSSTDKIHVMVDLETLSTRYDASIISIGAIKFNPHGDDRTEFESWMSDPDLALDSNKYFCSYLIPSQAGHIETETIIWWLQHPEAGKEAAKAIHTEEAALNAFTDWLGSTRNLVVWAKSPSADCVWLKNAWNRQGKASTPWTFKSERDVRTIQEIARDVSGKSIKEWKPDSILTHTPLVDCALQIYQVQESFRMMKK